MNMNYYFSLVLLISALVMFCIGFYSLKTDKLYVSISLFPLSILASGYAFEILCTSIEWVKFWVKIEYLGGSFVGVLWLMFALNFTGYRDKIKLRTLMLLFIMPVITLIVNYTNNFHNLFYKEMYMNNNGHFPILKVIHGPWYWFHTVYNYVLMVAGLIIFIKAYLKAEMVIKKQILLLIIAWIIPWISDIIYISGLLNFDVDLAPLSLAFSAIIYSFAFFKYKFVKLTPIAIEKVFSSMLDGVIILDSKNNIVNFNKSSINIIPELKYTDAVGKNIEDVFTKYTTLLATVTRDSCNDSIVSIQDKELFSHYKMNINYIYESADKIIGKILILNDITEQKKNRERMDKLLTMKESMLKIGYSINEVSNINDLLQLILNEVISCIDERSCGSILLLEDDNTLKIAVAKGYNLEDINSFTIMLKEHFSWFNNGENIEKTVIFNNIDKMKDIKMLETIEGTKIKSSLSSPIIINGKLYGFLNIDSIYNNIFNQGDLELMEYMRNQVALSITKHKLYEEILYLSRYDKLTNVYNRSYFEQLIYNYLYSDNPEKKEFLAVLFDLNDLKFVNDNYGHYAGDDLIITFSTGLCTLAEPSDIIGRFGGDEFVGVFYNTDPQSLTNKLEELLENFKNNPIVLGENEFFCSYSYGIVSYPADGTEFDELLKTADKRMYEYKRIIKNKKMINSNEMVI